jgi:hypothetical protein
MKTHPLDIALAAAINGHPDLSEDLLRAQPQDDARVLFNLGWHELRHGNLSEGLKLMDAGRFINCFGLPRIPGPIWRDEPLEGKTLLFRCEGGYGDQILNFRFAKDFAAKGARILVSCAPELKAIFSRHGFICVDNEAVHRVHYDYWVPAMSAAHILGYEMNTLSGAPYLTAEPRKLFAKPSTLRVGVRWAGSTEFEHQQHRLFPAEPLVDLHALPGVTLYSLQRDDNLIDGLPFADLRDQLKTWEDAASIIAGLDLVISSCTSTAHMAAALGVETWVIVPVLPYYTWAVPGAKSAWYDAVRLFRQEKYGEWDAPLNAVGAALKERASVRIAA